MPFAGILGQDRALSQLRLAWRDGRLSQAYCFFGPAGVGKRTAALALAQAVNCLARPGSASAVVGADACGTCPACRKIATGVHPDVTEVGPEGKTVITIDQVREVTMRAALHAYEGKTKVFILNPAELMQEPAANAILKTLEEPVGATLFILVTGAPSALLPTILSRCQMVRFDPLGEGPLREILLRSGRTPEEAAAAAALAGGSAERALSLDVEGARADRDRILREAWDTLGSLVSILERAEELARDREGLEAALEILMSFSRDLAVARLGGAAAPLIHADRRTDVERLAAGYSMPAILGVYEAQAEAQRALTRNANPRFTAERMLLRMRRAVGGEQEGGHASRGTH